MVHFSDESYYNIVYVGSNSDKYADILQGIQNVNNLKTELKHYTNTFIDDTNISQNVTLNGKTEVVMPKTSNTGKHITITFDSGDTESQLPNVSKQNLIPAPQPEVGGYIDTDTRNGGFRKPSQAYLNQIYGLQNLGVMADAPVPDASISPMVVLLAVGVAGLYAYKHKQ
jgi:hypothetical protein